VGGTVGPYRLPGHEDCLHMSVVDDQHVQELKVLRVVLNKYVVSGHINKHETRTLNHQEAILPSGAHVGCPLLQVRSK
jgi:hypothetical protein